MSVKKKKNHSLKSGQSGKAFLNFKIHQVNEVISRLEKEVEGLFKKMVKRGEVSRKEIKTHFDEVFLKFRKSDFYLLAKEKSQDLEKEIRRLSETVVDKIKNLELAPNLFSAKKILKDAKKNLNVFVNKIENNDFLSTAIHKAENTRNEILSFLSIPSQTEVGKLEKKISNLEKRLQNLSKKAA